MRPERKSNQPESGPSVNPAASSRGSVAGWNREIERGALVIHAFCPDTASVALENSLGNDQADARAGEVLRPMQSLEGGEKFPGIGLIETRAIISHVKHRLAA